MSASRLQAIDRIMRRAVQNQAFPGAAVIVGRDGYSVLRQGYGRFEWTNKSPLVSAEESIFDLASLTKVVGTTTAAMILFDEGRLPLDAPVKRYLPEFASGAKAGVTIRMLLTHTSGLPAGRLLWGKARNPSHARQLMLAAPLQCAPGRCFQYSDVGAATLGWVIERITGQSLDAFLARRVFEPLKMTSTSFRPAANLLSSIVPTQHTSRRGYALRGEVHDETAYLLGGVAGHAGLFSSAADLAAFAQMMLNRGELNGVRIVADSTVRIFTTEHKHSRALGWETANGVHGSGNFLSESAYGHTGFTGTSMWIDPERRVFVVLLTNRVFAPYIRRSGDAIADVRNDLADAATLAITSDPSVRALAMPVSFRTDTARTWNRSVRPAWRKAMEAGRSGQ
jgi:CubicO group peptidase (beta-lactamase class C family)